MITNTRPTSINSTSVEFFLIRFHISMVKMTEQELNTEVSEDISAAIITATIIPLKPTGITSIINFKKRTHLKNQKIALGKTSWFQSQSFFSSSRF